MWDFATSTEEILRGLDDLVRQGKVLYVAMSNAPAWEVARMQTMADLRGWSPLIALQVQYSLIERGAERDLIPMAQALGLGVTPYSPLGGGGLSGKYTRADLTRTAPIPARARAEASTPAWGWSLERTLAIADAVREIAAESCTHPPRLHWPGTCNAT